MREDGVVGSLCVVFRYGRVSESDVGHGVRWKRAAKANKRGGDAVCVCVCECASLTPTYKVSWE